MILALIAFAKMLKRRASKRFVLVETGEELLPTTTDNNNAPSAIPNIVAIDLCHNNNGSGSSIDDNHMHSNNNNNASTSLLGVTTAGTIK